MSQNGNGRAMKKMEEEASSSYRVLVVDDDCILRKMHKMMLTRLGIEVEVAENGKAAVDLHIAGASFNLILMDLQMPVMDGSQATKELRGMGVTSPIVGVTAVPACGPEKEAFVASGLTDCVSKPLTLHKIANYLPTPSSNNINNNN